MVGAVGETASMKRRKLWKMGEDGLCCSSSAIQTRLDPSSLLEERSETPIVFVCFFCVVGYPPNWGKRPRYIDRDRYTNFHGSRQKVRLGGRGEISSTTKTLVASTTQKKMARKKAQGFTAEK